MVVHGATRSAPQKHLEDLNSIWLQLRGDWSWIVVVPTEPDFSTAQIAHSLSQVGRRLSSTPIDFIQAYDLDLGSSAWLIDLLRFPIAGPDGQPDARRASPSTTWTQPAVRTVMALQSPLAHPEALPVALAADGVVLCIRRGRAKLASVRETIAAVGAENVFCCALID